MPEALKASNSRRRKNQILKCLHKVSIVFPAQYTVELDVHYTIHILKQDRNPRIFSYTSGQNELFHKIQILRR